MSTVARIGSFKASAADADKFIEGLYRIFLGRAPDANGLDHYRRKLAVETELDLIEEFATSREYMDVHQKRLVQRLADMAGSGRRDAEFIDVVQRELSKLPMVYDPVGETSKSYHERVATGFFDRYCSGPTILDVGFEGYDNPSARTVLPNAIGIDIGYPGYDGLTLPFADGSVDTVFSSHCLEHILFDQAVIRDWHRVLRVGGYIVCVVPSQALYEKRRFLPSRFNADHKRMYTPASLAGSFETALDVNSYRLRHLRENDLGYDYAIGPDEHAVGMYEIEMVVEKIDPPSWSLA